MSAREPVPREVTIVANDVGDVGGMERVLGELIGGLCDAGHRVTVIARTCRLPARPELTFRRVPGPRRPFPIAYPWFIALATVLLPRWRRGIVICTGAIVLNRVDAVYVHYCHQVGPAFSDRTTLPARVSTWLTRRIKQSSERACFARSHARRFVCVSDGVAAEMAEHYPQYASRVLTIYNGVDTDGFQPGAHADAAKALREQLGIAPERLVAAFVGGDWNRKGLAPAIEALAQAPAWDLLVAGAGDEARHRELAVALGVGARLHLLGVRRDVGAVYDASDAFVLPSAYETFSLVTFEAAASGLPIVATPVNGVRELIRDGENGYLVRADAEEVAARLTALAADPELRRRLGASARSSAQSFTWLAMVVRWRELLAELDGAK